MAELVGGAVLGLVFTELWNAVKEAKDRSKKFKPQLMELERTLGMLDPMIEDIKRINTKLNESDQSEMERLKSIMEDGKELVSKCLGVSRRNFIKKSYYQKKLVELDNKTIRFNNKILQLTIFREVKYVRLEQRSGFDELSDQIQSLKSDTNQCKPCHTGTSSASSVDAGATTCSPASLTCSVPGAAVGATTHSPTSLTSSAVGASACSSTSLTSSAARANTCSSTSLTGSVTGDTTCAAGTSLTGSAAGDIALPCNNEPIYPFHLGDFDLADLDLGDLDLNYPRSLQNPQVVPSASSNLVPPPVPTAPSTLVPTLVPRAPSFGTVGLIILILLPSENVILKITAIFIIICKAMKGTMSELEKSESGIWTVINDVGMLGTTMEQLDDTMSSLVHVLEEIESNSEQVKMKMNEADLSEAAESLRSLLEEGEKLVRESSDIGWWNSVKKWQYQKKMVESDNKLLRF